ncbi:hypothetical protein R1sor_010377 [Riccia sorocarpa]|uniref:RRM domain-containing protein n=1 Tax=Riccia sorocarpa TaxID=122646 RepID=A0ABD3HZ97_9MARC
MAASCVSASLTASVSLAFGRSADAALAKQTGRCVALTAPLTVCLSAEKIVGAGLPFLSGRSSVSWRNAGIAARAADLEEVETAPEETLQPAAPEGDAATKLYVGNLPWSVHSTQVAEIFQDFGNVELVEVIYDRESQRSRGFAFVKMSTAEEAQRAIEALDGSELDGRVLKVNFPQSGKDSSRRREERPASRERNWSTPRGGGGGGYNNSAMKIFAGNLSWGVDDVALDELFSEYGKVVEAKVIHDKDTGRSRGFGFVTMTTENEVNAAIQALDGAEFDGRTLRVNRAGDKPDRRDSPGREY